MVGGGSKNPPFLLLGDDTIPRDGQVKKFSSTPPTIFSFGKNMKNVENAKYMSEKHENQ